MRCSNRPGAVPLLALLAAFVTAIAGFITTQLAPSPPPPAFAPDPTITSGPPPTPPPTPTPLPTVTPQPTLKPTAIVSPTPKAVSGPPGTGASTIYVATDKGTFKATIMSLDGVRMQTDTASDSECSNDCPIQPLADYVAKNGGFAGVNGTYFCPTDYAECSSKKNTFDFPVYNSRLHKWMSQASLGWGGRSVFYYDGGGYHYNQNAADHPGDPLAAIINYPGLVNGGSVQIDDNQSGLSDKQKAKGTKVSIGTRGPQNVMVVLTYSATMLESAHVMKSLGAVGALNLDDGGSTALYYSGRYLAGPGRSLPNAVIFAR